jgi:hypothetical protein
MFVNRRDAVASTTPRRIQQPARLLAMIFLKNGSALTVPA